MTSQVEREVTDALELFIATITRTVEREAMASIRAAFARVPARTGRAADPAHARAAPSTAHARLRVLPAPTGLADVRQLIIARLREAPNSTTTELSRSLGMTGDSLRRHLRKLVRDGTICFQERFTGFGGQRHRVYFVVEPVPAVQAEPSASSAEATA